MVQDGHGRQLVLRLLSIFSVSVENGQWRGASFGLEVFVGIAVLKNRKFDRSGCLYAIFVRNIANLLWRNKISVLDSVKCTGTDAYWKEEPQWP